MKTTTLKTYLITLLVLLLSFALMLTAFACTQTDEPEEDKTATDDDFTSLISNGNFSSYSDGTQPYTPDSWTAYTPDGYSADDKIAGVVDTGADYAKNSAEWGNAANPFGEVKDEKVLMIYNKEANVYGYSNSFTASDDYYKISVKVKVLAGVEGGGATVRVSSDNGVVAFTDIPASDAFTTYTIYLIAPADGSTSIKTTLSLGFENKKVKGYVFFDDVIVETSTEADYNAAEEGDTVKRISMLYPDGEFGNYTYASTTPYTVSGWTLADGNTSGEDHALDKVGGKALSTGNIKNGVLSVASEENWKDTDYGTYPGLPVADSDDKNVLMIAINKSTDGTYNPSACYYYSNKKVSIEPAGLYEISVWVRVTVDANDSAPGDYADKAAHVVLKGTDDYSIDIPNTTTAQSENNGWVLAKFFVLGNQFSKKDFEIQLWLGDDKESATLTQGKAFFDKLTVTKVMKNFSEDKRNEIKTEKESDLSANFVKVVNLVSVQTDLIANNNFETKEGYDFAAVDNVKINEEKKDVIVEIISKEDLDNTEWTDALKEKYGIDESPKYPYSFAPVLIVNNTIPSAYTMKTSDDALIEIEQSQYYRLSVWIKTIGLDEDSSVTLKLENEDGDEQSSFSVNTAKYVNSLTNDYAEYSFYLKGALPVKTDSRVNSRKIRVVVTNGSGTAYDPSSYKKGAFLIANINMEKITNTEYSSASTGDYATKKDYAENDATVSNGNFNSYDMKKTVFDQDSNDGLDGNPHLTGFVSIADKDGNTHLTATPSDWTVNVDSRYGTTKEDGADTLKNQVYYIDKNSVTPVALNELNGREVTTIHVTGPDYDKVLESDSEWNKIFTIDAITDKLTWASTTNTNSYTISKGEGSSAAKTFTPDLLGKAISKITIAGPSDYSKVLDKESDWEKYFIKDASGSFTWAETDETAALADGTYSLTVTIVTWSSATTKSSLTLPKTLTTADTNEITVDEIKDREILKVTVSGPNSYSKIFKSATEWNTILSINTTTGKVSWKNTAESDKLELGDYTPSIMSDLKAGQYTLTVNYDEKSTNDLIAGVINVNALEEYLAQFGLTGNAIYDNWSDSLAMPTDTTVKNVTFGAPNLLMITTRTPDKKITLKNTYVDEEAKNDMTSTPAVKSSTFSLSANSYYLLKCYAKSINGAIGQIYVTTTSTDAPLACYTVEATNGWVEYNFFVQTGLSSVSAAFELYYGEKDNADEQFGGTLLFDSFSYKSLTEGDYNKMIESFKGEDGTAPTAWNTQNAKFTTITFDNSSAKEKAVTPSGFSATNSSSANSDTQVSGIIAKDHYKEVTDGKNNLGIYETVTTKDDEGNETSEVKLTDDGSLSLQYIFDSTGMEDGATVGDYVLLVNNRKATYQSYYMSSLSLESEAYYRFSAYVRTAKIAKDNYAKVYVSISDEPISFEVNTEYDKDGEAIDNKWQKLTFYFKNEKSSSVSASIYFQLGENSDDGKMTGYLFVDNVSLSKITQKEYEDETAENEIYEKDENEKELLDDNGNKILSEASKEFRLTNVVTVLKEEETKDEGDDEGDDEEEEKTPLNTTLLWTYITSIVIAVILIAVIVILLIRKYRRPKKAGDADKKVSYDRSNAKGEKEETDKSASARDDYKD